MGTWTTLVLGGARSGKSALAERLAGAGVDEVCYLATGPEPDGSDRQWADRIEAHRLRRPRQWRTVEVGAGGDLAGWLRHEPDPVLVDSLGGWLAESPAMEVDVDGLCQVLVERAARRRRTVLVGEEVGLGVHPPTVVGRQFRDALGQLNQAVAAVSDRVLLVVADRVLPLERFEEQW